MFSKIGESIKIMKFWIAQSPKSVIMMKRVISRTNSFLFFEMDLKVIFLFSEKLFAKVIPVEKIFAIIIGTLNAVKLKRITKSRIVFNPPTTTNQNSWLFFSFSWRFFTIKFLNFLS